MNKNLKILSAVLLISSAGVLSAMDDAVTKEGLLARIGTLVDAYTAAQHGQVDQHLLAAVAMQPHHALLAGTDTDILLQCMQSGDMQAYFVHTKNDVKAKINAFVDSLLPYHAPFLNDAVPVGAYNQPGNAMRDAFKAAIDAHMDSVHLTTAAVPANAKISSLARFQEGVESEIVAALDAYINTLSVADGQFLAGGVMVGGSAGQPADNTRDAFKNALMSAIFN